MLVRGAHNKDGKSTRDKANIGNPKVNKGCSPLTANHTSAVCVKNSLGPSVLCIPLGVYHSGSFNAMTPAKPFPVFQNLTVGFGDYTDLLWWK